MTDASDLPDSLRNPQLEPNDHCYVVLQDFGANGGGWAPVAIEVPWQEGARPFVYTGTDPNVLRVLHSICKRMVQESGRPTMIARYTQLEEVAVFRGPN